MAFKERRKLLSDVDPYDLLRRIVEDSSATTTAGQLSVDETLIALAERVLLERGEGVAHPPRKGDK